MAPTKIKKNPVALLSEMYVFSLQWFARGEIVKNYNNRNIEIENILKPLLGGQKMLDTKKHA